MLTPTNTHTSPCTLRAFSCQKFSHVRMCSLIEREREREREGGRERERGREGERERERERENLTCQCLDRVLHTN